MKPDKNIFTVLFFLLIAINGNICFSQPTHSSNSYLLQGDSESINNESKLSNSRVVAFSEEVYMNCPQYVTPELLSIYSSQIDRVKLIEVNSRSQKKYPLLSTIPLRKKCNPNLAYDDSVVNILDFNPLKYFFNFNSQENLYYRIENSKYVVVILPSK